VPATAEYVYGMLAPGGLLLATNVDPSNPIRNIMGYIFEWCLIERTGPEMSKLIPEGATKDDCKVTAESTGCNVFLEVRKTDAGTVNNDPEIQQAFADYDRQDSITNSKGGLLAGDCAHALGSFTMDYFVYPQHLWPFFQLRLASGLLTGGVLGC